MQTEWTPPHLVNTRASGIPSTSRSCNDEHVLVLVLDGAQPVIEIPQLAIISHFGHIPRVNEDVLTENTQAQAGTGTLACAP